MGLYYNGKKVRNLYYNGKCITRLALGKEMTRLVEGDDFVRAKWLVGDGSAYIDTNILLNDTSILWDFNVRRTVTDNSNNAFFWFRENVDISTMFLLNMYTYPNYFTRIANFSRGGSGGEVGNIRIPTDFSISEYKVECTDEKFIINSTEYPRTITGIVSNSKTLRLFKVDIDTSVTVSTKCNCEYFNVTKNGVPLVQLTPVRLLRPIPATLDANDIARNADECGMYDSISGKFYGNVNTDGTFTVSDN